MSISLYDNEQIDFDLKLLEFYPDLRDIFLAVITSLRLLLPECSVACCAFRILAFVEHYRIYRPCMACAHVCW